MQVSNPSGLIYRLNNIINRHISKNVPEECMELSYTNTRIIRFIADEKERNVYQKDVEKEFGITRSTASRVLMLMEEKGLVTRHSVEHDARLKKLMLTEKSQRMNDLMHEKSLLLDEVLMRGFSDEEVSQLQTFIQRMTDNVVEASLHPTQGE